MATTKITSPDLFDLGSLNSALKLPSGTTAERPTSPSTGEWRYNTTTYYVEFWDGGEWRDLQSENMPPINSENFNTVLYTGTGSAQSITGVGFKPDWIWIKDRDTNFSHAVTDSTRGVGNIIKPNSTDAQSTDAQSITSFDTDGFSLGTAGGSFNNNGDNYVAWCWKANEGTTSSNTDGTNIDSTVQVNTKAGFSIVQFTTPGTFNASNTVGHGLGVIPNLIIMKSTSTAGENWMVHTTDLGNGGFIRLNTTGTSGTSGNLFTGTTSTVFNPADTSAPNISYIAYCFANVAGYSSFGTYTGNNSLNGPIKNTGFEPAFVMVKTVDGNNGWAILDNKRNPTNRRNLVLFANSDEVEYTASGGGGIDFLSNGFQVNSTEGYLNANGETFIYIAFGSDASTAPALADSFANKLYDGNGGTQLITGLGFSPSMVWLKGRSFADNHNMADTVRGPLKYVFPNSTDLQFTSSNYLSSFDSDGFTLGNDGSGNASGQTFVAWTWKANSIPTINTTGTIQSIASANQTAGFSIVSWTSTSSSSDTIGHGLGVKPDVVLYKKLSATGSWFWYTDVIDGSWDELVLNSNAAKSDFAGTYATSTTFKSVTSSSGANWITYCFASVAGFSKMGTYNGSGSDGNVVATGFKPSWVIIKRSNSTGGWLMFDSARSPSNPVNDRLEANNNQAEQTNSGDKFLDFNATDFEANGSDSELNASGGTYIYMAFKENPGQYAIPSGQMGYLVAAGGGGSSSDSGGGAGAGAGGLRTTYGLTSGGGASAETNLTLATGTYTITVGAGGTGTTGSTTSTNGVASTITGTASVSTVGGGGGGDAYQSGTTYLGKTGGSGGGSGNGNASVSRPTGGAGTANEGFGGGGARDYAASSDRNAGGGGGGATSVGITAQSFIGGNGGFGLTSAITGNNISYAGGGGGGCRGNTSSNVAGQGFGGGGNATNTGVGNPGTANTGGGAGGGRSDGAAGGSGVVVLRLNTSDYSGSTTGSPTITTNGSETILTYTGSGTYVHS